MVIAFLDLLGFSWLVKNDLIAAYDNLISFNNVIHTKIIDNKTHPIDTYDPEYGLREFAENAAVTSFYNMISVSDSLIIASHKPDLFVKQLSNFVSSTFMGYSEPFKKPFEELEAVLSNKIYDTTQPHKAFPILFRGGISMGNDVIFKKEIQVFEGECNINGLNVCGTSYVEAVKLEKSGKGPRLFCNKRFVDSLTRDGSCAIRYVENDIYEIVWTYYACEATSCSTNKTDNIFDRVNDKLLPRAINLYRYYYKQKEAGKTDCEQEYKHYEELIILIYRGLIKYAHDNNLQTKLTHKMVATQLSDLDIKLPENVLNDFI